MRALEVFEPGLATSKLASASRVARYRNRAKPKLKGPRPAIPAPIIFIIIIIYPVGSKSFIHHHEIKHKIVSIVVVPPHSHTEKKIKTAVYPVPGEVVT